MIETTMNSGFAAIIGRPNAGKSTLMNKILGEKVAITSPKPQTTRNKILGIYTKEQYQIIFIDTPGMFPAGVGTAKTKLGEFMQRSAETARSGVDCVILVADVSRFDRELPEKMIKSNVPVILALNKIDCIPNNEILPVIEKYRKYPFTAIIPISAKNGVNVDELLSVIKRYIPEGPRYYPSDLVTDQPELLIISEIIREKALRALQDEIPHGIAVMIQKVNKRDDKNIVDVEAEIYCEKESHKGMIIGKNGEMLKRIGSMARIEIEELFGSKANLQLWVRVKKDWRNVDYFVRNFGYDIKNI